MQHTVAMRVIDGVADLAGVIERQWKIERALARDDRLEVLTGNELHHDEENVLLFLGGDDGDDVGMVERGEQSRFAEQFAEIEALLMRNLQRDFLVNPGVFGQVDRAEAAAADCGQNLVFANDLPTKKHRDGSIASAAIPA